MIYQSLNIDYNRNVGPLNGTYRTVTRTVGSICVVNFRYLRFFVNYLRFAQDYLQRRTSR
jgi:hypothetical protein